MPAQAPADATVAALLHRMPQFDSWLNQPLSASLWLQIEQANEQELMTLAAESLRRLAQIQPLAA